MRVVIYAADFVPLPLAQAHGLANITAFRDAAVGFDPIAISLAPRFCPRLARRGYPSQGRFTERLVLAVPPAFAVYVAC